MVSSVRFLLREVNSWVGDKVGISRGTVWLIFLSTMLVKRSNLKCYYDQNMNFCFSLVFKTMLTEQ